MKRYILIPIAALLIFVYFEVKYRTWYTFGRLATKRHG